eukprot:CAMPEP_0181294280 /NCGR_PEP_ID=MMETSP1101-20121128/3512_1 /TAXON_ID=46948 /ORGANISM="Rhodomonas abbreviata, Strain Caron Lab Isolate" /LENGTH=71 /DNA_ID=CAMNT_0023398919 /DNA_START=350 /DNA_END=565 /DNA_ORIENTATION=+
MIPNTYSGKVPDVCDLGAIQLRTTRSNKATTRGPQSCSTSRSCAVAATHAPTSASGPEAPAHSATPFVTTT